MLLGAHEGIAGGVSQAFTRAEADGADCLQIFTRNARGWTAKPLEGEEVTRFRGEAKRTGMPVAAHATYLINLACADAALRRKSWDALAEELSRCEQLGIPQLIFHPGSHEDEAEGLRLVVDGMVEALQRAAGKAKLLVETTAGQGSSLGWRFEQVAAIRKAIPAGLRRRVAVCVDTCHVFAAGYDLTSDAAYDETIRRLDDLVGLANVQAFHLNDSQKGLGCRVDRHAHIGDGAMGLTPFRNLVNDDRFDGVPGFVETDSRWKENIAKLRSLRATPGRAAPRRARASGQGRR